MSNSKSGNRCFGNRNRNKFWKSKSFFGNRFLEIEIDFGKSFFGNRFLEIEIFFWKSFFQSPHSSLYAMFYSHTPHFMCMSHTPCVCVIHHEHAQYSISMRACAILVAHAPYSMHMRHTPCTYAILHAHEPYSTHMRHTP